MNSWIRRNDESSYSILQCATILPLLSLNITMERKRWCGFKKIAVNGIKTTFDRTIPFSWVQSLVPCTCYRDLSCNYGYPLANHGYLPLDRSCSYIWHLQPGNNWNLPTKKGLTSSTTCKVPWQLWLTLLYLVSSWCVALAWQWSFEISCLQIANRWKDWLPKDELNLPLLPAIFTALSSGLLGKKGMNSTKSDGIIIVLAVGLSFYR